MKRQIAIIAGGDSSENEVSLRSASGLYSFMDKERYDVTIVVLKGKEWHTEDGCPIDKNDFSFTRGARSTSRISLSMARRARMVFCRDTWT